jgi:hypothetical protein
VSKTEEERIGTEEERIGVGHQKVILECFTVLHSNGS